MEDERKADECGNEQPTPVGEPVVVPVEVDPAASGTGYEVEFEREAEEGDRT